jgi:hypothetical protein
MLRAIPSSALDCCVDGARIPASALRVAGSAHRLDSYARRRAAAMVAEAQAQAQGLRHRAAADAYREASVHAARVLMGVVEDIGRLRSALVEGVMTTARQSLREHCAEAGFATAWVERACEVAVDDHAVPLRLQVPRMDSDLFSALCEAFGDSVAVDLADVPCLRLEQGELVLEYDPEHAIFDAATQPPLPDAQALHDGLAAIASRYADVVVGLCKPSK